MQKRWLMGVLLGLCAGPLWAIATEVELSQLNPSRAHRQASMIMTKVIERYHYRNIPLDDGMSGLILDRYLDSLDPSRSFFTQQDVKSFTSYQHQLDDALKKAQLDPAYHIFRVFRQRVEQCIGTAIGLLDSDFDFGVDEDYRFDRSEAHWEADKAALDELWRKRVKNDVLGLRLAGKAHDEIKDTLRKRYEGIARRIRQLNADDVFQTFVNAYTLTLEPHTSYMSPHTSENFDISMRLSLEGIGAVLATKNEHTVVQRTVTGGPAALSGQIAAGDRIVAVAQGEQGELVDVIGWRLQDVVDLVRGPKDSVVRLQLIPKEAGADGPTKLVTLVRNKIKLEDQAAQKEVIKGLDDLEGRRIGVITVPTFYRDFQAFSEGDENFRSTTRDVRQLLKELQEEGVDGVVIDLRGNGGGSLTEATELTGLFIDTGPVVQVKDSSGRLEIERDAVAGVVYDGPLAVLVDHNSASASEIFAGAIQDYHRGIIIGEPTFGKGTVQTLLDLDRFVAGSTEQLGRLRLTMAQFFRVSGGSTQFKGVVPDIVFPTAADSHEAGERGLDNALPWAHIEPAKFSAGQPGTIAPLLERHSRRVRSDIGFQFLLEEGAVLQQTRDRHTLSLLEIKRKKEWDEQERKLREARNRFRVAQGLEPLPETHDQDLEIDEEENERISQIMVNEAARILVDHIQSTYPRSAMLR